MHQLILLKTADGKGTPIEFVRMHERGTYRNLLAGDRRPYVVLVEVKKP